MNEQDQQIALCEWMGWKIKFSKDGRQSWCKSPDWGHNHKWSKGLTILPDTNSLDVLHEMEKKYLAQCKTVDEKSLWLDWLMVICGEPNAKNPAQARFESQLNACNASAPQRREALLRTLNLWKEGDV